MLLLWSPCLSKISRSEKIPIKISRFCTRLDLTFTSFLISWPSREARSLWFIFFVSLFERFFANSWTFFFSLRFLSKDKFLTVRMSFESNFLPERGVLFLESFLFRSEIHNFLAWPVYIEYRYYIVLWSLFVSMSKTKVRMKERSALCGRNRSCSFAKLTSQLTMFHCCSSCA